MSSNASGFSSHPCRQCGCAHLFRHKHFNRKVGVALVGVGILLAFFTYGLSLLAVTVVDWILYTRVSEVATCYQCGHVIREADVVKAIAPFNLSLYDYYENMKRSTAKLRT